MQLSIPYGTTVAHAEIPSERLLTLTRRAPQLPAVDPVKAVRSAVETPARYPALRRALTPDDHVTIIVDERLPRVAELIAAVLDHMCAVGITPDAVTLLCPPTRSSQAWIDQLPDIYEEVHVEIHDPGDRKRLAYLATTRGGRRIYLNRAVVEADQLVVLSGLGFNPLHGYAGPESLIYPALSDLEARRAWEKALTIAAPDDEPWPVRREAEEILWLLGAPFLIQVVRGSGDEIVQVLAGSTESLADGRAALDSAWRATVDSPADIVVAGISASSSESIDDLARALACASRVISDEGTIVLLTSASPEPGDGLTRAQQFDEAATALSALQRDPPADLAVAYQWLRTCVKSRVILHSGWPTERAESLFVTPMEEARQLQRVLDAGGDCLVLPDAHRLMVTLAAKE